MLDALRYHPIAPAARQRLHLVAFAPILAAAAALRLYDLGYGHPGLAIYTSISSHAYKSFHNWFYPNMFADGAILADKPPLFFWYQGLFIALLGPSNVAFRMPAALAGICSVILLYVIVRRCSGTTPALVAALTLAVMPIDVNYSRATFIEPVAAVVMMFATWFVVRAVQERREGFYYAAAFALGLGFMVKLWLGLLPAPAFALVALAYRWQSWRQLVRTGAICAAVFLVTAFWWPVVVWLTPGAYDAVMHADSVWDMIFGWNLLERYGDLEYGARHRKDILWFVTGPMSVYFGASLVPAAAIGAFAILVGLWERGREMAAGLWRTVSARWPRVADRVERAASLAGDGSTRTRLARSEEPILPGLGLGILWVTWFGIALVGFGVASIRLATYWAVVAPAVAALAGIGVASIPGLLARRGQSPSGGWVVLALALVGALYCAAVYGRFGEASIWFDRASTVAFVLAFALFVAAVFMYFGWRPLRIDVGAATLATACVAGILLTATVTLHNLANPRDDTLGRIGFDQIDMPGARGPELTRDEERKRRQGALITAIVRIEPERLESVLEYAQEYAPHRMLGRRGDSRYLLASDSYNTGAMVALITGEPVLPLYSEYKMEPLVEEAELKRLLADGSIPFILTTRDMLYMDFDLYARVRAASLDVTIRSGLPAQGEYELLRVTDW